MATVRKRSWRSGGEAKTAWIADYFDQSGKRHLKTFATKKAADAWLVTTRHEVAHGVHTPEGTSVTVAGAAQLWIRRGEVEQLERSTLAKYRNHVELHIDPFIGGVKLARLSPPMIEQFRDDLLGRMSWAMARKVLTSLKSILAEATRRGLVARNAAQHVKIDVRKRDKRKLAVGRDIPAKAEVTAILGAATGRWRPLLIIAAFTGMRSSELRGLPWDAVDLEHRVIHVRQRADQWGVIGSPKSEAGHRTIPMAPMVLNALREWKLACPRIKADSEGPGQLWLVFPNGDGKPESHTNIINRGFNPIQAKAGVSETYGMHALRHFFASWAIEQGFSPKRLQALLGHASIQMTFDVYGHLFPSPEDDHAKFAAGELAMAK
jgi:integrase